MAQFSTFLFQFILKDFNKVLKILIFGVVFVPIVALGQLPTEFQKVELIAGLKNSINFEFAPDGRIFILDRYGKILIFKPETQTSVPAGTLNVFHDLEDGLLSIAFDPNFATNNYIYIHYSPASVTVNRVSRFQMNGDQIVLSSEVVVLEWPTQRECCFHAAGDMDFDSQGNLYIATGDNTNHSKYATLNETDSNESSENTSSNTNDLRGKILRIKPENNGTYSIPEGNLFPGGTGGLPEIYVMGARNPFKIFVDKANTDWLFWGEVGPDANFESNLGPEGMDEINLTKVAGNYGWPYFSGKNEPYLNTYATPNFYYNQNNPINISVWNTGAEILPPATPSWLEFFHECYLAGPRYYFNSSLDNPKKLPSNFHEAFFYYDFNSSKIWVVKMDNSGNILSNEQFATGVVTGSGFIDLKIGPDGQLYILEYGAGCCPNNTGTGKLVRIDFIGIDGNHSPEVSISADRTSGSLPLTVNFSSSGTSDIDGDALIYEWDFQTDGIVDSNEENPSFTYTQGSIYNAQLRVDDSNGGISSKSIQIYAGNNAATFDFISPRDGGFVNWFDNINYHIVVNDQEDGSTADETIDCDDLNIVPSLGHLNHFHDNLAINQCEGTFFIDASGHDTDGQDDIYLVFNANYTDANGLTSFDQIKLHPKLMEAEFYDLQNNTFLIDNTDNLGGGNLSVRALNHNSYIVLEGRNLLNINSVSYRVASNLGGTIEIHAGSATGPLLSTVQVPVTGSLNNWINVEASVTDPGGKNDLYFVFKKSPGDINLFDLNYVEFKGIGVSIDETPPDISLIEVLSPNQISIKFNEALDESSAEQVSNYSINNGISISSADLQDDRKTVFLITSTISQQIPYELTVSNVANETGIIINQSIVKSFIFNDALYRINSGGPELELNGTNWDADQFNNGTRTYANHSLSISNTTSDELYQTELYGNFTYSIPVPQAGYYRIALHFAEIFHGVKNNNGIGARIFNVDIENGQQSLRNYDIIEKAGAAATAIVENINGVYVSDGVLSLVFTKVQDNAKISAIEIFHGQEPDPIPSITILTPSNGATVTQPFNINFELMNWEINSGGKHIHKIIDGEESGMIYTSDPINITGLSVGSHTIELVLANEDHEQTEYSAQVQLNVVEEVVCPENSFPEQWMEEIIGSEVPYRSVYIFSEDIDGDGFKDIVLGAWWYKNPGASGGNWVQKVIGSPMNNMSLLHDFDNDGDIDIFGTRGTYTSSEMAWAQNDGTGNFTIHTNIPAGTSTWHETFMAGAAIGNFNGVANTQIAITWNGAESSDSYVQMLTVPADPVNQAWSIASISPDSYGEAISAGDIDGDGDLDLFQGANWLRNDNGSWTTFSTGITLPSHFDRNALADIDNDGNLDGIVNQIGINQEVSWFKPPTDPTQTWTKLTIGSGVDGALSLDVVDLDGDGDLDILTGEWKNSHRLLAFENDLCNTGTWIQHVLHPGGIMDHHDGTQAVDIDNDGDLDIISLGWEERFPRIYRNSESSVSSSLYNINSGGPEFIFSDGTWQVDQFFNTGSTYTNTVAIGGTLNDKLYQSERSGSSFTYNIPVNSTGPFTVKLHFAEIFHGVKNTKGVGARVFNVNIENGQAQLQNYDIIQRAGATATAIVETFSNINVVDGNLTIAFTTVTNNAKISGIEIIAEGEASNEAPVVTNPGNQIYSAGQAVNLQIQASDPDGDALIYSQTGLPPSLTMNSSTGLVSGTLAAGSGDYPVTITISDGNLSVQTSFNITVNGSTTNASPVLASIGNQNVAEGASKNVNIAASDPDGNIPDITASGLPPFASFTDNNDGTGILSLAPGAGDAGNYPITITATDAGGLSDSENITISVTTETAATLYNINSGGAAFSFSGENWQTDQYADAGSNYAYTVAIGGTLNDKLYQSERSGSSFTYNIPVNSTGPFTVKLHFAEIFHGVKNTKGVGARVFNVNIENGQAQLQNYDIIQRAGATATAIVETFSNINVVDGNLTIAFTTVTNNAKISGIEIIAEGEASNEAPVVTNPGNQIYSAGQAVNLQIQASDPDGDALIYSQTGLPPSLTMNSSTGLVSGTLAAGAGDYPVTITISDGNLSVQTSFNITVNGSTTNASPVLASIGNQNVAEGASKNVNIAASDPDGNIPDITASGLPPFASFTDNNDGTGILSLAPGAGDAGNYPITITATDAGGLSDSENITISVTTETAATLYNINSGGAAFSFSGENWQTDQYADAGSNYAYTVAIGGTLNDKLYQSERSGSSFTYNIPVNSTGPFTVKLHFAEIFHGVKNTKGVGARVFNVNIENGQAQLQNYDIIQRAGATATAIVETFSNINVVDGNLTIAFTTVTNNAKISGIEIIAGYGNSTSGTYFDINNNHETLTENFDEELSESKIVLYPNPAHDRFTLDFTLIENHNFTFYLFDGLGRKFKVGNYNVDAGNSTLDFDISSLSLNNGLYYLNIESDEKTPRIFKLFINR